MIGRLGGRAEPCPFAALLVDDEIAHEAVEVGPRVADPIVAQTGKPQPGFLHHIFGNNRIAELAGGVRTQLSVIRLDER